MRGESITVLRALLTLAVLTACGAAPPREFRGHRCAGTPHERSRHLPLQYYFQYAAGELDPRYPPFGPGNRGMSEEVLRAMRSYPPDAVLQIEGYAGPCPYEMQRAAEISLRRAQSVRDEIVGLGFARSRTRLAALGTTVPTGCCGEGRCSTSRPYDTNRRVEITVLWCE